MWFKSMLYSEVSVTLRVSIAILKAKSSEWWGTWHAVMYCIELLAYIYTVCWPRWVLVREVG